LEVIAMSAIKTVVLKNQLEVTIRPMKLTDLQQSLAFFRSLPEQDRTCLRRDATTLEVAEARMRELAEGQVHRLVAVVEDKIVAEGALELAQYGWERHIGELRLIIAPEYQGKGLGMLMGRALYDLAGSLGVEQLVARMMACQTVAISILQKLGFRQEAVLRGYLKDCQGRRQDLVLMRGELEELWRQFEQYIYELDVHGFETE
jgi:L-amino acid N-acyltransferase YncA